MSGSKSHPPSTVTHESRRKAPGSIDAPPFASSIVSYPDRGPDGSAGYRGNTSGRIVRSFLATYHRDRDLVCCDPMQGSGTTGDAARALGIPYHGFDLKDGFDAARVDILNAVGAPLGSAFVHPAYAGMIAYSGGVWGAAPHEADLSAVGTDLDAFDDMLHAVLVNVYRALAPGAFYGVLLGIWRFRGEYHHLPARMLRYAPGVLSDDIIKAQNNVRSASKTYSGSFVPIDHEHLLVFRRAADASIIGVTIDLLGTLHRLHDQTWRTLVVGFARERGSSFGLEDLYRAFDGHPRAAKNPNYRAKLRQVVRDEETLRRVARGRYAFVPTTAPERKKEIVGVSPIDRDPS